MTGAPLRVLCLDIEGGHGGSSKSLFELVRHMAREEVTVEVICRQHSHLVARYTDLGVACSVWPGMPAENSVQRTSRNLAKFARGYQGLVARQSEIEALASRIRAEFDLVHFNHEALFLLAATLRRRVDTPFTMHGRTTIVDNAFGRWQCRVISRSVDEMVFITENEQRNFHKLGGALPSTVVHNAVGADIRSALPLSELAEAPGFKVAHLNSYSPTHGGDRVIEVAAAVKALGRSDLRFVVAGQTTLTPGMSQRLRPHAVVDLREYAERCNVSDMVRFLGHVAHTDRVLASCDALISPSRLSHPWGRAIIEALAAGKPVVATGTYDRFVKPGVTGLLHATYDPQAMARDLVKLADDAEFAGRLGAEGAQLISSLCDGANQAAELKHVWRHTLAALAARKAARNAAAAMAAAAA